MIMQRGNFPALFGATMLPALDELIMAKYGELAEIYSRIFRVMTSTRSIEQTSEVVGFSSATKTAEGIALTYDRAVKGFDKTYTHDQWASGFITTRVMVDDDKWSLIRKLARDLGRAMSEARELDAISDLNNGFSGSFVGPDGVALFSASHPSPKSGVLGSNVLGTPADLGIAAIELALIAFRNMTDDAGKRVRLTPKRLVIPSALEFAASEILNSSQRADTPNNAVNAFKHRIGVANFEDVVVAEYLSDPDAWFVAAEQEETELRFYWREKPSPQHDVDFDTRSIKTAAWMRFSHGWSGWRGWFGTPGA